MALEYSKGRDMGEQLPMTKKKEKKKKRKEKEEKRERRKRRADF